MKCYLGSEGESSVTLVVRVNELSVTLVVRVNQVLPW